MYWDANTKVSRTGHLTYKKRSKNMKSPETFGVRVDLIRNGVKTWCQYKSLPNRPFDLQAWPWPWTGMVGTWVLHIAFTALTCDTSFTKILQPVSEIWNGNDFERTNGWADRRTDRHTSRTKKYLLYTGGDIIVKSTLINFSCASLLKLKLIS